MDWADSGYDSPRTKRISKGDFSGVRPSSAHGHLALRICLRGAFQQPVTMGRRMERKIVDLSPRDLQYMCMKLPSFI